MFSSAKKDGASSDTAELIQLKTKLENLNQQEKILSFRREKIIAELRNAIVEEMMKYVESKGFSRNQPCPHVWVGKHGIEIKEIGGQTIILGTDKFPYQSGDADELRIMFMKKWNPRLEMEGINTISDLTAKMVEVANKPNTNSNIKGYWDEYDSNVIFRGEMSGHVYLTIDYKQFRDGIVRILANELKANLALPVGEVLNTSTTEEQTKDQI